MRKVSDAIRVTINYAIVAGDGLGKPLGFMNPTAGIPILDTAAVTPAGQISWQDLGERAVGQKIIGRASDKSNVFQV